MNKSDPRYQAYLNILKEELVPAMGCTEPIALAYAAAVARKTLGQVPDEVHIGASGSIIKNVKSVIVPNTGHLKGIPAAAAAGIIAGDPDKKLEVISSVSPQQIEEIKAFLEKTPITVSHLDNGLTFDIEVTVRKGEQSAKVRIANYHTNIVKIEKDGKVLEEVPVKGEEESNLTDRKLLDIDGIWDFIHSVDLEDLKPTLEPQVKMNVAIAEEGMKNDYGANIGKVIWGTQEHSTANHARAMAAAGSDARMNGCEMPVVINSGSGNQGITASVPVVIYAKELGASEEQMYRALALSNLTAIHEKTPIGRLSAFCGAVSAGVGAGAGIAYLNGGDLDAVKATITNALAIVSGMVCDGAKASCAAKIATAVDAGIMGYRMYQNGQQFQNGDGLVGEDVEADIANVGRLAKKGMHHTNEEIIKIMIGA